VKSKRPRSVGTRGAAGTAELPLNPTPVVPSDPPFTVPVRDKLTWDLADIAALTGLSRRLLERELSAGRMPRCDLRVGRRCLWRPETIHRWIEEGGHR
jgi:hypothetical protein